MKLRYQLINMKHGLFILLLFLLIACNNSKKDAGENEKSITAATDSSKIITANSDSQVLASSSQVLTFLKNKAFVQLAGLFHPDEGVRFSPYGYIDTVSDIVLNSEQFLQAIAKKNPIHWGYYDGSGDSILLTAAQYYKKFIYNADFLHAEKSSINERISFGNSLDNLTKIYPGCNYTESHFSGFDKKYAGMDWTSLKLVFKIYQGKNYLVGIVHDQWTI